MLQLNGIHTRRQVYRKTRTTLSSLFHGAFIAIILIALCSLSTMNSSLLHSIIGLTGISIAIPIVIITATTRRVVRGWFFPAPALVCQKFTGLSNGLDLLSPVRYTVRI